VTRIRPARLADASGIAAVHVPAWRSAYAGILPDAVLTRLSIPRQALYYQHGMIRGCAAYVAEAQGRIVGFVTADAARRSLGDGEVETLYVLDDWREQGLGRALLQRAAGRLKEAGCRNLFLWVLRDNPSKWFYQRLGGRHAMESHVMVGGVPIPQTAYVWDPIDLLLPTPARR